MTEILLLGLLAWGSGSQATQIAWFPSRKRHQGCSWPFQMGLFCLSERCVSCSQLDSSSSSISPNHRFINIPLPLLLGHPGLELVCARAQQGNVFPGSAVPVGSFWKASHWAQMPGGTQGNTWGTVPCTVYGLKCRVLAALDFRCQGCKI